MEAPSNKLRKGADETPEESLMALFFGVGRILKSGWPQDPRLLPSFLHLQTLRFIDEDEDPSMSSLAGYLMVAAPTATALVTSLVKDGIIVRQADSRDRRRVRLALSPEGKRMLARTRTDREKAFDALVAPAFSNRPRALAAASLPLSLRAIEINLVCHYLFQTFCVTILFRPRSPLWQLLPLAQLRTTS